MGKVTYAAFVAAFVGVGGTVYAADIYSPGGSTKDAPVYIAPATWSGFYIGGNAGGAFGLDKGNFAVFRTNQYSAAAPFFPSSYRASTDRNEDEFIGGVHAGFNIQRGTFVYGLEGDADFGDTFDYLASIRGRAGFTMGDTLIFATGGAAFLRTSDEIKLVQTAPASPHNPGGGKAGISDGQAGFVVGGGFDHKVAPNVSVGLEALYYSFDGQDFNKKPVAVGTVEANAGFPYKYVDYRSDGDFFTVRGRLTYHFAQETYVPLK